MMKVDIAHPLGVNPKTVSRALARSGPPHSDSNDLFAQRWNVSDHSRPCASIYQHSFCTR